MAGQNGWSEFFSTGDLQVNAGAALAGTKGAIGSYAGWNTAHKPTGASVNLATDDVTLYSAMLLKYTGDEGAWFFAASTGGNNGAKLESRLKTSGIQFAGLNGYDPGSPSPLVNAWNADQLVAAVFKIATSGTDLVMSIGVFDVAGGLPEEGSLTYDFVRTYDRSTASGPYTHVAFGPINDATMGDNLVVTDAWGDVQSAMIPEPGTMALVLLGLGGLVLRRRR